MGSRERKPILLVGLCWGGASRPASTVIFLLLFVFFYRSGLLVSRAPDVVQACGEEDDDDCSTLECAPVRFCGIVKWDEKDNCTRRSRWCCRRRGAAYRRDFRHVLRHTYLWSVLGYSSRSVSKPARWHDIKWQLRRRSVKRHAVAVCRLWSKGGYKWKVEKRTLHIASLLQGLPGKANATRKCREPPRRLYPRNVVIKCFGRLSGLLSICYDLCMLVF